MIPDKIKRVDTHEETPHTSYEINRSQKIKFYENGKVVGKLIYDRLSSAVSLINELKILATIKFTQLEIRDDSAGENMELFSSDDQKENLQQSGLIPLVQIKKILNKHIAKSQEVQMPCSLILMALLPEKPSKLPHDKNLLELTSIIGKFKGQNDHLSWYSIDEDLIPNDFVENNAKNQLNTGTCLILPSTGLIRSRLLINEIKKQLDTSLRSIKSTDLCVGIGVKTSTDVSEDELFSMVNDNLKKSIQRSGKVCCFTDTFESSQVTVAERTQLFMISKKVLC